MTWVNDTLCDIFWHGIQPVADSGCLWCRGINFLFFFPRAPAVVLGWGTLEGPLSRFIYHSHIQEGNQCLQYDLGNEMWRSAWSEEIMRREKTWTAESTVQRYKNNVDRVKKKQAAVTHRIHNATLRESAVLMLTTFLGASYFSEHFWPIYA